MPAGKNAIFFTEEKRMKKFIVSVLMVILISLPLFAGGGQQSGSQGKVIELTQFTDAVGWPACNAIWGRVPEEIEKKTGAKIKNTIATTNEEANLMVASGDIPDLITVPYNGAAFAVLAESALVADLMPLIRKNVPEFYDYMGAGYWNFFKSNSGVNNFFANWAFHPNAGDKYCAIGTWNLALHQRVDIFEALGSPDLSTPEKLLQHLIAVRDAYPDVKPLLTRPSDSLPFTHYNTQGLQWFAVMYGIEAYYEAPNGSVIGAYNHPRYPDLIKFLNALYRERILTREDLAGTNENFLANFDKGNFYMTPYGVDLLRYPPKGTPNVTYQSAQAWDTTAGTQQADIAGYATFLSRKCKNPDEAIKLMAYAAMQEGDRLNQWGQENVDWEWDRNGAPVYTNWYRQQTERSTEEYLNAKGILAWSMNWSDHEWVALNLPNELPHMRQAREVYQDYFFARLNFLSLNPSGNIPESITYQQCKDYWNQTIPQIIMASSEAEAVSRFENLKSTLASMGMPSVERYYTGKSDKIVQAFGRNNLVLKGADNAIYHRITGR
jgi:putative aldouronate transport system substrate-binding protein